LLSPRNRSKEEEEKEREGEEEIPTPADRIPYSKELAPTYIYTYLHILTVHLLIPIFSVRRIKSSSNSPSHHRLPTYHLPTYISHILIFWYEYIEY